MNIAPLNVIMILSNVYVSILRLLKKEMLFPVRTAKRQRIGADRSIECRDSLDQKAGC